LANNEEIKHHLRGSEAREKTGCISNRCTLSGGKSRKYKNKKSINKSRRIRNYRNKKTFKIKNIKNKKRNKTYKRK